MTMIQSPDTTSVVGRVSTPTDSSSDLYQIHIQCNVGVSDDYGGNVYIGAFKTGYGNIDTMTEQTKMNIIELLTTNQDVPNFPFTASKDVPVSAIGIANVAFQDASSSSSTLMEINQEYSVYVMVVDNNGNQSELFYGQRGRIDPQAPPIIEVTQVTTNDQQTEFSVDVHTELRSTVEFEAKYLLSSANVTDPLSLDTYFKDDMIFNTVGGAVFSTGNRAQTRANVDISFTNVVNDTSNPGDYDPWIDLTKELYLYVYVINSDPHRQSNVSRTTVGRVYAPKSNIDVTIESHNPRDTTAEIRFRVHDAANTMYYVALFEDSYNTDMNVKGSLKEHVIGVPETMYGNLSDTNFTSITLSEYYTQLGNLNSIANIQTQQTYYAYMLVRDPVTYQYSDFRTITVTTGSAPRVLRSTGQFNLANVDAGDTENTIYVTANIEEENGGNVYGALIVGPELTSSEIELLNYTSGSLDLIASSLPNPSNSFVSRKFTHAYANIDAYQNGIQSNIETDTTYYVYFVMTDTLNNQQKLHLKQPVFQTSAEVETAEDSAIDTEAGTGDFTTDTGTGTDTGGEGGTGTGGEGGTGTSEPITTKTANSATANIDVSFYNGHKVYLQSIVLDLSASACTDVDSVKIYASNTKDVFTTPGVTELNLDLSQNLVKGTEYKINNVIASTELSTDTQFSFYRIVLQRSEAPITIVDIKYNILVHDDRGPELSNLSASHNGGTNAAVMEFTVADFSNVEATMFMSRYEYGITEELKAMHSDIAKTQYTGPPQHFLYGQDANITSNVVYKDPSKDPMKTDDYNSDDFDQYYFYIYSQDTGKSNDPSPTYTKVNPTGRADVTASPVISDRTVDPMFVDGDTAIRVTANISQPSIEYTPFKYVHFAVHSGLLPPTTIPYGEYQFSNISNHVTYLRETVAGYPIQEGNTHKYNVYTYAISGAGNVAYQVTPQPVSLPSNKPTVSIDKLQTAAEGTIRLEFSFSDEFAAVDVYAGLFATKPTNVANIFQSPAIRPDFQNANVGSNIVDFTTAYSYSNPDTDPTATEPVDTINDKSYYVIVYARETNTESNLESQTEAVYGFTMGQQSAEDLANVNGQEGNISTDTIDDIEVILLENESTVLRLPFVTSEDPDVITITALFFPTSSDEILPKPEATLFTLGDYRLVVKENDQLAVFENTTELFELISDIKLSLQEYNEVVFVIDKVLNEIEVGIGIQDVVTANVDIDSIGNITGQISAGPFLGGLADIKASEEHMPPPTVLTQMDVLPPKITVDLANVDRSTVDEFMFPVGTFEIEDSYPSNVSIGLFDVFYGDSQPFAGVYASLRTTLLTSGKAKQFPNLLSGAERSTALDEFVLTRSHASADGAPLSVVDAREGTYHIYAFVEDTQTPTPNETIRYCGVLYGSVKETKVANTPDPILGNLDFAPNSDKQIYNITVTESSNVNSVYFAAYPKSMSFGYSTRDQIKAQMQTYGTLWYLNDPATTLSDGYFADVNATSLTPFEYNQDYLVYALGVNTTTGKTVLSENGVTANTALDPFINSVVSTSVFSSSTNTTSVTVTIEIEEQSAANVYVALFDAPQKEAAVIRFFEGAEFVDEPSVRSVLQHTAKGHGDSTIYTPEFTSIHTDALFYDSDVRIHGSHTVHAYAYVKNTEYDAHNTAFGNADADVLSYADYDRDPTITATDLTVNDQSFVVSYQRTTRGFTNALYNVPIRFCVGAFTSKHSDADLISFFRDANEPHVVEETTSETIGGSQIFDVTTSKLYDGITLLKAVTLPRLNAKVPVTTYVESNTRNYRFYGSDTTLTLLKGRTYYFDQSDSLNDGHPIYFATSDTYNIVDQFTEGVTYVVGDNKYTSVTDYTTVPPYTTFNEATTRYVRFDVPTTPSGDIQLYYQCRAHSGMNGSVTLVDDPTESIAVSTKTQAPNTTYRIYSFVEDDTPRKNNAVSSVQSQQTGAPPTVVFNYAAFTIEPSSST
jgi:hypothetical protein